MDMQATMQPPEYLLRRLISEHGERHRSSPGQRTARREDLNFPLIPNEKTGPIMPVTGTDLVEIFALDSLAPG